MRPLLLERLHLDWEGAMAIWRPEEEKHFTYGSIAHCRGRKPFEQGIDQRAAHKMTKQAREQQQRA